MLPPSGQASGSRRCWKTQSWGPGIQSFEVVNMNFGYFGQHTRCMKKPYWLFLLPPSGQASCSRRCWKRHSKGTGIQRFEAVIMNIRYTGQHNSSIKTLWVLFDTTFRASFKLQGVGKFRTEALASRVLKLLTWIWGICVTYLPSEKILLVLFDTTIRAIKKQNTWKRDWHFT